MKRAAGDIFTAVIQKKGGSPEHLLGRFPCEGEEENMFRFYSELHEVCHPVNDRPRFTGSGARDDEVGAVNRSDRGILSRVQFVFIIDLKPLGMDNVQLPAGLF